MVNPSERRYPVCASLRGWHVQLKSLSGRAKHEPCVLTRPAPLSRVPMAVLVLFLGETA